MSSFTTRCPKGPLLSLNLPKDNRSQAHWKMVIDIDTDHSLALANKDFNPTSESSNSTPNVWARQPTTTSSTHLLRLRRILGFSSNVHRNASNTGQHPSVCPQSPTTTSPRRRRRLHHGRPRFTSGWRLELRAASFRVVATCQYGFNQSEW